MGVQQFPVPESGIPKGATGARPASPTVGTVFYDGTISSLVIWDGSAWLPCSAPSSQPTISVADVGTGRAYNSAQATVTFTKGATGGKPLGYTVSSSTGGYSATTTSTTVNITVGTQGSWTFSGNAYNDFGISPTTPTTSITLTTIPEAASGVTAVVGTGSNINVSWTLGATGGKNLSALEIVPFLNGTTEQTATSVSTSATTGTVVGLTGGSSYTFKVRKINDNGTIDSTASTSIVVPIAIDYLVVAGGAGGGAGYSGAGAGAGGGAGGLLTGTSSVLFGVANTVTVGGAGAGGSGNNARGASGSNSQFGSITACVGGGFGAGRGENGGNGGSGGGAGGGNAVAWQGGLGTTGQGTNGANGFANATSGFDGGGLSTTSSISGTSLVYAVQGYSNGTGAAGTANRGNGGSSGNPFTPPNGGAGGSGVVIIRYSDTVPAATTVTGSPTITVAGGYRVYRWTGSGSITL